MLGQRQFEPRSPGRGLGEYDQFPDLLHHVHDMGTQVQRQPCAQLLKG